MGLIFSHIYDLFKFSGNKEHRILMLGLDASGKTTILYKMKLDETVTTIPTIGFNCESIQVPGTGMNFLVWDVGGQERLRPLWRHYFINSVGLIFVLDSSDKSRFEDAANELSIILEADEMQRVPVVIIANKQDMPGAASTREIESKLRLQKIQQAGHEWWIQEAVAIRGEGLLAAFTEMSRLSKQFIKNTG